MNRIYYTLVSIVLLLSLYACDFSEDVRDLNLDAGKADFSVYVSLGNSLTAGTQDGALYISAQKHSYPAILAQQMEVLSFNLPLMADELGGIPSAKIPNKMILGENLLPSLAPGDGSTTLENMYSSSSPIHNLGVPGAKVADLHTPGYHNPYYMRFKSASESTVLADAMALNPTFFSLWIGANDVLAYATGGGMFPTTPVESFAASYNQLLQELVKDGAKGVVASLPDVVTCPYFTAIPYDALTLDNASYAAMIPVLNENYGALNQAFDFLGLTERKITFSSDRSSPLVVFDKDLEDVSASLIQVLLAGGVDAGLAPFLGNYYGQARQLRSGEMVLLTAGELLGNVDEENKNKLMAMGMDEMQATQLSFPGITLPLADAYVLTEVELKHVDATAKAYDEVIRGVATSYDVALYDARAHMIDLHENGWLYNGVSYSSDYITGGLFSLDGIHPNQRGYAVIANGFIDAINAKYGSNLKQVDPNAYKGIEYP